MALTAGWFAWFLPAVLIVLAIQVPWKLLRFQHLAQHGSGFPPTGQAEYFYNEISGEVQWVDPGGTPFEDETGARYWSESHQPHEYVWLEQYSEELKRPFYYNQETKESVWERPADLAWRRVKVAA